MKMGILKKLRLTWKSMSTKDKIGLVIDLISGAGCGIGGMIVGSRLSEGRNPLERICIKTATAGLGLVAGEVSSKALKENYGEPVAVLIERVKAKSAEEKEKEAAANE